MKKILKLFFIAVLFFQEMPVFSYPTNYRIKEVADNRSGKEGIIVTSDDREVPHILPQDIAGASFLSFDKDSDDYQQALLKQGAGYAVTGILVSQLYINDIRNVKLVGSTERGIEALCQFLPGKLQRMKKRLASFLFETRGFLSAGFVAGATLGTLMYYSSMLNCGNRSGWVYDAVLDKVVVYRKKTFSHSERYGDIVINYYNISDPVGYLTFEENEAVRQADSTANKNILRGLTFGAIASLAMGWLAHSIGQGV